LCGETATLQQEDGPSTALSLQFQDYNGSLNGESMAGAKGRQMTIREPTVSEMEAGRTADNRGGA